jgi:hypothetical protein
MMPHGIIGLERVKRRKVRNICITRCFLNIMGMVCYVSGEGSAVISMNLIRQSAADFRSLHLVINSYP